MKETNCNACLFVGTCPIPSAECDFFSPVDELCGEQLLEWHIKRERLRFHHEWLSYIEAEN